MGNLSGSPDRFSICSGCFRRKAKHPLPFQIAYRNRKFRDGSGLFWGGRGPSSPLCPSLSRRRHRGKDEAPDPSVSDRRALLIRTANGMVSCAPARRDGDRVFKSLARSSAQASYPSLPRKRESSLTPLRLPSPTKTASLGFRGNPGVMASLPRYLYLFPWLLFSCRCGSPYGDRRRPAG